MNENSLAAELVGLIGEEGFLCLVEKYGGTRLYVPRGSKSPVPSTPGWISNACPPRPISIARVVGKANAEALAGRYEGSYLRVPLARELRARRYREAGDSNAQIARKLGITETGVDKIFARMVKKPEKGVQMDLFEAKARATGT